MCVSHVRRMAREKAAGLSSMRALSRGCSARDALDAEITSGNTIANKKANNNSSNRYLCHQRTDTGKIEIKIRSYLIVSYLIDTGCPFCL